MSDIFTWWNGTTLSTRLYTKRHGLLAGEDSFGNRYYTEKPKNPRKRGREDAQGSRKPAQLRRWVIYNGVAEATKVPPEWFGWLHHMTDKAPSSGEHTRGWQKPHVPNMTGTPLAWRPAGSILLAHRRRMNAPDYEPWRAE